MVFVDASFAVGRTTAVGGHGASAARVGKARRRRRFRPAPEKIRRVGEPLRAGPAQVGADAPASASATEPS